MIANLVKSAKMWCKRHPVILISLIGLFIAFWFCLPKELFNKPTSFVIESREGKLLGASIAKDGQWRFPKTDSVPYKFEKCILAFEDKRFYYHPGIDILALARAMRLNIRKRKIVSGGSTITMQTIRLATGKDRTFFNKSLEAIRALRLELTHSKAEILSIYSSNAPFGTNVVGIDAAAWRYFGRSANQLSWGEMAALAVLPNSPSLVHPGRNRMILQKKRNKLIDILEREKTISASEATLAKLEPVPAKPFPLPQLAPHLLALAKNDFRKGAITETGIKSSLQTSLQERVTEILERHHNRLAANEIDNCAALILDVESGQALAYNGNIFRPENPLLESHVDMIQGPRSPGSTLKPLLYAAMLNEGMLLPNSLIPDIPTQIAGYQPNNYDLGYDGAVPASKALARSLNVPAVKMLQQYRYEKFYGFLKNTGISTLKNPADFYGLSLILGGCETTMWELAGTYASMARALNHYNENSNYSESDWHKPTYQIENKKEFIPEKNGKINAAALYYTFQAMNEVMRPGDELIWQQFTSSQKIAWKTGTSYGFRDGWAIGITPKYVVAVWAGNADGEGRPGLTGIDAAAPILFDIFNILKQPKNGWFKFPSGEMTDIDVCTESGFRASDLCSNHKIMKMPLSCLKAPVCSYHKLVHLDKTERWQVNSDCELTTSMVHKSWFVLPPTMEYYYKTKNYTYRSLPPLRSDCETNEGVLPMELIYPKNNAKIYIPLEIDGQQGQVIFSAAHRNVNETILWHLDNKYVGKTQEIHQLALNPSAGKHEITLIDQQGRRIQQSFTIIGK